MNTVERIIQGIFLSLMGLAIVVMISVAMQPTTPDQPYGDETATIAYCDSLEASQE